MSAQPRSLLIRSMVLSAIAAWTIASCSSPPRQWGEGGGGSTTSTGSGGGRNSKAGMGGTTAGAGTGAASVVGGSGGNAADNSGMGATTSYAGADAPTAGAADAPMGGTAGTGTAGTGTAGAGTGGKGAAGAGTAGAAGQGTTAVCTPNATQCSGSDLKSCGSNGQWGAATSCGTHRACTGPVGTAQCACNTDPICKSVSSTCSSTMALANCAADGNGCFYQASSTACSGGCSGSACCSGPTAVCGNTCCDTSLNYCSGTICVAKASTGQACSSSVPCASASSCSNGYCCGSGLTGCSLSTCVNTQTSNDNCGACNKACTGGQTCSSGTCACALGAFACSKCLGWNFESSSTSGWSLSTRNNGTGTLTLATSTGKGNFSMMIQNANFPDFASDLLVKIAPCSGVALTVPSNGFTFSVDVLFQSNSHGFGDDTTGEGSPAVVLEGDGFSHIIGSSASPFSNGLWYTFTWTLPGTSVTNIDLRFAPQAAWYGNIILDNISLK
ncbi:MAG: hypothetical protein ABIQ16_19675 [Polyangiaceae bacterium]